MKILVTAKRVVDPYVRIRFANSGELDVGDLKHSVNPFDEIAIEQAVQLKEQGVAQEVIVVAIGPSQSEEALRTAVAMGADRAILVACEASPEPIIVARVLQHLVVRESIDLVILGKQGIDGDCGEVAPMLAGLCDWTQATAVARLAIQGGEMEAVCEADDGTVTVNCRLPAVVSVDLRLNTPRYASLPGIMRARKKPIERVVLSDLPVDAAPHSEILRIEQPPQRAATCVMVESAEELAGVLKREAKVI